eukprot:gene1595-3084_t
MVPKLKGSMTISKRLLSLVKGPCIETCFTKALGLIHPIVLAPMGGISGSKLASAVADAGGNFPSNLMSTFLTIYSTYVLLALGFVGTGGQIKFPELTYIAIADLIAEMDEAENITTNKTRLGIGLVIETALERDPSILASIMTIIPRNLWLSYGQFDVYEELLEHHSFSEINLFLQVSSIDEVKHAADLGAKAIVLRGYGAGGYTPSDTAPRLHHFIPEAKRIIQEQCDNKPFLLAAGGVTSGEDLASCLLLGADGVCIGTRFAATIESDLTDTEKQSLLTQKYDRRHLLRTNPDDSKVYSGIGTKNIHKIKSAAEVIEEIVLEAVSILRMSQKANRDWGIGC